MAIVVLGSLAALGGFTLAAAWLLATQEPTGRHHLPTIRVQADLDQETIPVSRTESQPPAEFFGNDPEWVELARSWHVSRSSVRALVDDAWGDAVRCSQIRAELRRMYEEVA